VILEGLVTTLDADGSPHLAPMGPGMAGDFRSFELKPFPTSHTYTNLRRDRAGVLHVTDDALLLAHAAIGRVTTFPPAVPASAVRGVVLADCCRAFEFVVTAVDDSEQRVRLSCEVRQVHERRPFWGWNRAKHAVLEAAILATRLHLLPATEVEAEFRRLRVIVDKTGGDRELEAMAFLEQHRHGTTR
jgi:hypothetical protein